MVHNFNKRSQVNSLHIANEMYRTGVKRYTSLCACNSAKTTCRSHIGCQKWCDPNKTCHKCAPAIACQFCYYSVKPCPTKCQTPRKCHAMC